MQSPRITDHAWGRIEVAGHGAMKDAKLWPGGARAWDWNETGTRHRPGIQVVDVEELLAADARRIILSRGRWRRLQVPEETVAAVEAAGASVEVLTTDDAILAYNRAVAAGERVGALMHSTC